MVDEYDLMAETDENSFAGQPRLNFGKLTLSNIYKQWKDKQPTEVTLAAFSKLDVKVRSQDAVFSVDIKEFNPNLTFTYERKVQVGSLDWNKIFKPSLFKALSITPAADKDEARKQFTDAMKKIVGAYVCVEDVSANPNKAEKSAGATESKYNTIKLVTLYPDRASCYSAWKSKYGGSANGSGEVAGVGPVFANGVPEGYTPESWTEQKEALGKAYATHVQTLKGTIPVKRTAALAYVAENEAGSTPEQLAELIGV